MHSGMFAGRRVLSMVLKDAALLSHPFSSHFPARGQVLLPDSRDAIHHVHPSEHRLILSRIHSGWFWFPVWLEKVNVEGPCPVLKYPFLCNETVVTALASSFVREVHCTFIGSRRLIVMIGYGRVLWVPAEVWGHHAVNIDPVTELQSNCHGEPASAQPSVGDLPVFASLLLEELIELQHLVARDHEGLQPRQHLAEELQVIVHLALAIPPHVAAGAPEDEHGALAHVEQVMAVAEDPLDAGMCDDSQACAVAHVKPVASGGGVIHTDNTLCLVDVGALLTTQQMP